jgi:hypothetical protein
MGRRMNLYHVTLYNRAVRILDSKGIDPKFSQGKRQVMWYVSKALIPWAIAHIAQRNSVSIDELAILHVRVTTEELLRTTRRSVYCSTHVQKPLEMDSAVMWLQRQERRVFIKTKVVRGNGFPGSDREEEDELS